MRLRLAEISVRELNPTTEKTAVLKNLVNHSGTTSSFALANSLFASVTELCLFKIPMRVLLDEDLSDVIVLLISAPAMNLLVAEWIGAGPRKEEVVTHSMYACVTDAVLLSRGAMRRAVSTAGESVSVRPRMCTVVIILNV